MAVYYTDLSRTFGTRLGQGTSRDTVIATAIVAVTTAMIDNTDDVITLFRVPRGAVVTSARIAATDMDTNASPTLAFNVGDAGSATRLFAASAVGQAGTFSTAMQPTALLYKYTADTLIQAAVSAVAATGAAGTLTLVLEYFVDPEFVTTGLTATTTA